MDTSTNAMYSAMQENKPFKSYIKTILGKVYVNYWDNFSDTESHTLLSGDPRKSPEGCVIDVWSQKEDLFFKKFNQTHLKRGTLVEYVRTEEKRERTIEEFTDDELMTIIKSPFLKLQNKLNSTTSVPVVFRMLNLARDAEKSEKLISAIERRLSELQAPVTEEE